jgi:FAD/FMN-containing dehydrogenase
VSIPVDEISLKMSGENFGVVTRFRFQLHPLGQLTAGLLGYPRAQAAEVLRFWRDFITAASEDLTTIAALMTAPDGHPAVGIELCHVGPVKRAATALNMLRSFGPPAADHVDAMRYTDLQKSLDATAPYGVRNYWKSDFMSELTDDAIGALVEGANRMVSPLSMIHIHHVGGAMAREPEGGSAFPHRNSAFVYNVIATWTDPSEDGIQVNWAKSVFDALRSCSEGVAYLNFLGEEGDERTAAAFGTSLERLSELKRRYDPDNVFHMNQNIRPAKSGLIV